MLPNVNANTFRRELWQTAVDAAAPLGFGPACAHFLRGWIDMGVERVAVADRLTPADLAMARSNIRAFVQLMKSEAVFLGYWEPEEYRPEALLATPQAYLEGAVQPEPAVPVTAR